MIAKHAWPPLVCDSESSNLCVVIGMSWATDESLGKTKYLDGRMQELALDDKDNETRDRLGLDMYGLF